tara:strand:- start:320 stop:688 length:369 start_codon:yes stop_codon:yes gene_type:complete
MKIHELDLHFQHTLLTLYVGEVVARADTGECVLTQEEVMQIKNRLNVIDSLQKRVKLESSTFTVNDWPSSQLCMDCEHGTFIMLGGVDSEPSQYACSKSIQLGGCATSCREFAREEEFGEME